MHGVMETFGAITFVNALPCGIGAAAGVDLPVRVDASVEERTRSRAPTITVRDGEPTALVSAAAEEAVRRYGSGRALGVELEIRSHIPAARGLKSSSAVSAAVVGATARALQCNPDPIELAQISADVSTRVGLSATGAFDDACASLSSEVILADNAQRTILRRWPFPADLEVLLWIPSKEHAPSPKWASAFRARAAEGRRAVEAALDGDLFEAMRRNTALVEGVMDYPYERMRERAVGAGAAGCGVSGLGPTVAFLTPSSRIGRVVDGLPRDGAEVRRIGSRTSGVGPEVAR
ncbi:MAG: shikimate kinase [Thermoplasmata archaeon]